MKILVSAGEESGDRYAATLVETLAGRLGAIDFFGCAGPRLRAAGVRPVIRAEELAVVGLVEVVAHLPRIYRDLRSLMAAAEQERPDVAILTDSPDFNLRLARRLARLQIPVVYLVAPQVWAWRGWRIRLMRRVITHLLCIFPFEEPFFRERGVSATYIGHPLAGKVHPSLDRGGFFRKHRLATERPLIALLPGSRPGEAARHLPALLEAVHELNAWRAMNLVLAASTMAGGAFFRDRVARSGIKVVEGETWNVLAHADLGLVASGTATVEAALLRTPMVTFYRVHQATWILGKWLVEAPAYSMVNLLAGRPIVPELIQAEFTPARLAAEARRLLEDPDGRRRMQQDLSDLAQRLAAGPSAMERAADVIEVVLRGEKPGHAGAADGTPRSEVRSV